MLRDMTGRLVPWWLRKTFVGVKEMTAWAAELDRLRQEAARISDKPCGADLDLKTVMHHLEAARCHMLRRMPYGRCDCSGGCEKCEGRKWLSLDRLMFTPRRASPGESVKNPN